MRLKKKEFLTFVLPVIIFIVLIMLYLFGYQTDETKDSSALKEEIQEQQEEESGDAGQMIVQAPVFSHESGFYEDSFELTIEIPKGTTVYYTLDCSTPTTESFQYQGEVIQINDASLQANYYSVRPDTEPYRPTPLYEGQQPVMEGYYARMSLPEESVDKCAVIRAVAVDASGNLSEIKTASYFVGYQNRSGYDNLAVMSIVSDPGGLFGSENGIMVNGINYEQALERGELAGVMDSHILRKYTNTYMGRGKAWERAMHMDFFNSEDKSLYFSQEAGIRLHGNQSRVATPQKSFNLYAREDYDGNGTFKKAFFEDGLLADTVTLMRGDDIRNYYLSEKMNHRTMDTQQYRMVQVFLDGEYWGMYALQERYSSTQYMKTHYNLKKGEFSLFTGGPYGFKNKKGNEKATKTSFRILKNYLAEHDLSDPRVYENVKSMMDIQSFIDCYAARIYTGDQDWNWYKNQVLLLADNKWHWIIYDMDYGAAAHDTAHAWTDTFTSSRYVKTEYLSNDPLFAPLMKNADFRRDFANTILDLANEIYSPDHVTVDMKDFMEEYWEASVKSMERYPRLDPELKLDREAHSSWYTYHCNLISEYFRQRKEYIPKYLKGFFSLQGELASVNIQTNDTEAGSVRINSICPDMDPTLGWTGSYFTDYPVNLIAQAKESYRFVGWMLDGGEMTDTFAAESQLYFSGNVTAVAVFEKAE